VSSVSKQAVQKFDMEKRLNLKKLNYVEINGIRLKSQMGLQLWKTTTMTMWTSAGAGKVLNRIKKLQSQRT
jgi:hypothetical protein